MELHLPLNYAKFLWGWPNKFIERMESVNTRVVIVAGNGKWSEGFDTEESLQTIPDGYNGYIWTNRLDKINKR
jgi:glycerophosphoryl diester phosphodiesterase